MKEPIPRRHRFIPSADFTKLRSDARLRGLAIEQLCHAIPIGAVVLDAYCNVLFCNREGVDLLTQWAGSWSTAKSPNRAHIMPAEIIAACHRLRGGESRQGQRRSRPSFGGRIHIRHERLPNLTAVVALDRNPRDRRFAVFCVLLQDGLRDAIGAGRKDQLALLTMAERRVAKLVAEGLRNSDIAAALGKSVMTVKSQLGTIFTKLAVTSRTQLATALRSSTPL